MTRILAWDGCVNVRDLGGLPLADGGETAYRVVVRSDSVRTLTDAGREALAAYGVRRIVDLRLDAESADDPQRELAVDLVRVPLGSDPGSELEAKYDARMDAAAEPPDFYRWSYPEFLRDFHCGVSTAVAALADGEGPVVVHCAGGKDRTGLVCALALRLAGVPVDAVADDWALSEASWARHDAGWVAAAPDEVERKRRSIWRVAPRAAMVDVLAELDARAYLERGGAPATALDRLRARLRGEA